MVQQRRFQGRRQRIMCPIRAFRLTISEVRACLSTKSAADLVEANSQKSAPVNQSSHRANALTERLVRSRKRLLDRRTRRNDVRNLVVFEADHEISEPSHRVESLGGLSSAPFPLERKWKRSENNDESVL